MYQSNVALGGISLAALCAGLAGCSADASTTSSEPEVENAQAPLNGTWGHLLFDDGGCNSPNDLWRSRINSGFQIAASTLHSPKMAECLEQAIFSQTSGWPEQVLSQMRSNQGTLVFCRQLGDTKARGPIGIDHEEVLFDHEFLNNVTNFEHMAEVILHEVSHNKGYDHSPGSADSPHLFVGDSWEFHHTVPGHLGTCSRRISAGQAVPQPFAIRRDSTLHEATLAPVGRTGGSAFYSSCRTFSTGLRVRSGSAVDAIGLSCITGTPTQLAGGSGGTFSETPCASDELLVGVQGTAGDTVTGIQALCARADTVIAGQRTESALRPLAWKGGTGGIFFRRWCPAGMMMTGIKGKSGSLVDRIEVECMAFASQRIPNESELSWVGTAGGNLNMEKCVGRSALAGLNLQTGDRIDRLGGVCREIASTCSGTTCFDTAANLNLHLMTGHGGSGGKIDQQWCAEGAAMVGLNINVGAQLIHKIGPICADIFNWSRGITSTSSLPMRGGSGGTEFTAMCAPGAFITGWWIRSGSMINAVKPICRNFP